MCESLAKQLFPLFFRAHSASSGERDARRTRSALEIQVMVTGARGIELPAAARTN